MAIGPRCIDADVESVLGSRTIYRTRGHWEVGVFVALGLHARYCPRCLSSIRYNTRQGARPARELADDLGGLEVSSSTRAGHLAAVACGSDRDHAQTRCTPFFAVDIENRGKCPYDRPRLRVLLAAWCDPGEEDLDHLFVALVPIDRGAFGVSVSRGLAVTRARRARLTICSTTARAPAWAVFIPPVHPPSLWNDIAGRPVHAAAYARPSTNIASSPSEARASRVGKIVVVETRHRIEVNALGFARAFRRHRRRAADSHRRSMRISSRYLEQRPYVCVSSELFRELALSNPSSADATPIERGRDSSPPRTCREARERLIHRRSGGSVCETTSALDLENSAMRSANVSSAFTYCTRHRRLSFSLAFEPTD